MNYEALGRYTANKEKAVELAARRDAALAELGRLAAVCIDPRRRFGRGVGPGEGRHGP